MKGTPPTTCPCGQPLAYPNVAVSFYRCDCPLAAGTGHYGYRCVACGQVSWPPEHDPAYEPDGWGR